MTLIALPTGFDYDIEWRLDVPAQANRSMWTGRRKVVGLPGAARWRARITVEAITTEIDDRKWRAFLLSLRGVQNTFNVPANCQQPPVNSAVVGSGATNGYTLPLASMPTSQAILAAGEFLTVFLPSGHHRLVGLTAPLNSNGSGTATAQFEPDLGEVPAGGASVILAQPYCPMSLAERSNGWSTSGGLSRYVFDAEEAL